MGQSRASDLALSAPRPAYFPRTVPQGSVEEMVGPAVGSKCIPGKVLLGTGKENRDGLGGPPPNSLYPWGGVPLEQAIYCGHRLPISAMSQLCPWAVQRREPGPPPPSQHSTRISTCHLPLWNSEGGDRGRRCS